MSKNLYKLTIPAENVSEDLTDFPVLINLDQTSGTSDRDATDVFGYFDFPTNVDDNFKGTDNDPANPVLWDEPNFNKSGNDITPTLGTIDIQNNKLKFDLTFTDTNTQPASITQLWTNYTLSGNFEIEVEFSDMFTENGEYILYYLIVSGKTLQSTFIGKQPDTMVFRSRIDSNTDVISGATTNDFGKFRLNRTGSTITTSYIDGNGAWTELQSLDTGITEDLNILLATYCDSNPAFTSSCNFDNFKLNSGEIVWGKENKGVGDNFIGNDGEPANPDFWLSPQSRSDLSNNPTTFAIKNNSLRYIQTLDVDVYDNSHIVSKYALSGDFDVRVDFTKVITPISYEFTFKATNTQNANDTATESFWVRKSNTTGLNYNASVNGGTVQTGGNDDTTGKFRLTRIGTTATCYYWNGSNWVQLASGSIGNDNMYIDIIAQCWGTSSDAEMQFDNYVLNNGTLVWDNLVTDLSEMEITVPGTQEFYQKMIELNPVTYWRMNETSGTNAVDQMGAYNGTYPSGVVLNHSISPTEIPCVKFNGTSDATSRLTTQLDVNPFSEITINFLIKKDNLVADSWGRIANWSSSYWTTESDGPFFLTIGNTGNIGISLSQGDDFSSDLYINSINDVRLEWRMVTITLKDNDHVSIFMDGKLDNTEPLTFALSNSTRKFTIGANAYSLSGGIDSSYLQGVSLSEFSVFNRILTDKEIADLYQESLSVISLPIEIDRWDQINKQAQLWTKIPKLFSTKDNELTLSKMVHDYSTYMNSLNPLAYYRLGETSGTIAYDENGSYNGTYVNSPSLGEVGLLVDDLNPCVKFEHNVQQWCTVPLQTSIRSLVVIASCILGSSPYHYPLYGQYESNNDRSSLVIMGYDTDELPYINSTIGGTNNIAYGDQKVDDGLPHLFCVVYDGTDTIFYIDGIEQSQKISGINFFMSTQTEEFIGAYGHSTSHGSFGDRYIDEVSTFNYTLTQEEITNIYQQSIAKIENPNIGYTGSSSAQDVWTEYDAVYHLSKDGTDSTGNTLDGSMVNMGTGNVVNFGQGKGLYFNGMDNYIDMGVQSAFDLSATDDLFLEHTLAVDPNSLTWRGLQNRGSGNGGDFAGFQFSGVADSLSNQYIDNGVGGSSHSNLNRYVIVPNTLFNNTMLWKQIDGNINIYIDGLLHNGDSDNVILGDMTDVVIDTTRPTRIGIDHQDPSSTIQKMYGKLKEIRFSKSLKSSEWIARNNDSINDNLFTFESLTFNHITGTIVETFTMSEWLVRAWLESDGSLTNEKIVTGDTFELEIVASRKFPHIVTVSPMIGDIWTKLTTFNFDDLIYPTDPVTNPYYFKCIIGGIGGELEPIWTDTIGDQVVDGGVTWELIEGLIQPITHYPVMPV